MTAKPMTQDPSAAGTPLTDAVANSVCCVTSATDLQAYNVMQEHARQLERENARLREEIGVLRNEERVAGEFVSEFDCVACGVHVGPVHHRYAPVCLKCVNEYHQKHSVSMIDAHRTLRDAAIKSAGGDHE